MTATQTQHQVVSKEQWLQARTALLAAEKELTRQRDEISRRRRDLPWQPVDKAYVFEGPNGPQSLADLFAGRSQLIVYHFMFAPNWEEGCKSCSFFADHFDATRIHLEHRDVTLAVVSQAPMPRILAFQQRMQWRFPWVSAFANSFQSDYAVHFTKEEAAGEVTYNYRKGKIGLVEAPGFSVFFKDETGEIFHTYSTYGRGIEAVNSTYQLLDLVPKGRDEAGLAFDMSWVRHHDKYGDYVFDPATRYANPREVCACGEHQGAA